MCTEEVAKEKVCPFISSVVSRDNSIMGPTANGLIKCLGSECAAWVFIDGEYDDKGNMLGKCNLIEKE